MCAGETGAIHTLSVTAGNSHNGRNKAVAASNWEKLPCTTPTQAENATIGARAKPRGRFLVVGFGAG